MLKFLLVAAAAALIIVVAAIAWGRFTTAPKPQALEEVEGVMSETPLGDSVAQVFGISNESEPVPINLGESASSLAGQLGTLITQRISDALSAQAIGQIVKQYDKLPGDQKQALEQMICTPK